MTLALDYNVIPILDRYEQTKDEREFVQNILYLAKHSGLYLDIILKWLKLGESVSSVGGDADLWANLGSAEVMIKMFVKIIIDIGIFTFGNKINEQKEIKNWRNRNGKFI